MYNRLNILSDVKILDLSRIFTGPFCTQVLSDLGAEVIKVEPPRGDDTRYWGPPFINPEMSSYFASLNRNKQAIQLDLKEDAADRSILNGLVRWADVILENYRPGVSKKLGVDFEAMKEINSRIVYASITGFGSTGPYRSAPSYDIIAQSESGIMSITGTEDGELTKMGVPIGDIAAGLYGAIGILAGLRQMEKTSQAQYIETNLFSSLTSFLTYQSMNAYFNEEPPKPLGTAHPNIVPYQSFQCQQGRWISLSIGNQSCWIAYLKLLNTIKSEFSIIAQYLDYLRSEQLSINEKRIANREKLIAVLQQIFLQADRNYWYEILTSAGIPVGKINTVEEVHHHPQIEHLGQIKYVTKADISIPLIQTPLMIENAEVISHTAPPELNEHRDEIIEMLEDKGYLNR